MNWCRQCQSYDCEHVNESEQAQEWHKLSYLAEYDLETEKIYPLGEWNPPIFMV